MKDIKEAFLEKVNWENKNFLYCIALFVFVLFLVYWWFLYQAAVDEVRDYFDERAYLDDVTYQQVSINPLTQTLTLSDIEIEHELFVSPLVIDEITVYDYEVNDSVPESIHFFISNINIQALELFRSLRKKTNTNEIIYNLVKLGYYEFPLDIEVEIKYDADDRMFNFDSTIDADDLGELALNFEIDHLKKRIFRKRDIKFPTLEGLQLLKFFVSPNSSGIAKVLKTLFNSRIVNLAVKYQDDDLFKRYKYFNSVEILQLPGQKNLAVLTQEEKRNLEKEYTRGLGASKELAENIATVVEEFTIDPDEISMTIEPEKPVRFKKLMTEDSRSSALKLLNMQFSN